MNRIVGIAICLFLAASLLRPIGDPDLGWHIAAGRWMLAHFALPRVDYWNAFSGDKPWMPYSWSSEAIFAAAEQHFGWPGLLATGLLFALFLVAVLLCCLSALAGDGVMGVLLTLLAIAGFQDYFDLRPQSLTWGFLAIAIYCGHQMGAQKGPKVFFAFFVLCSLWANTHLTVSFGILAAGFWALSLKQRQRGLKLALAGLFGSLCTPNFGAEWLTLVKKVDHPFLYSIVSEFQPASVWHPSAAVTLLAFILLAVLVSESPGRIPLPIFLLAGVFTLLGFAIQKFVPYAAVITCCSLALFWSEHRYRSKEEAPLAFALSRLRDGADFISKRGALVIVVLSLAIGALHTVQVFRHPIDRLALPVAAVDYIKLNQLPGPILNDFGDGGYLIYRFLSPDGSPQRRVSLDGRTNVNDPKIMKAFVNTIIGNSRWKDYFDAVNPNLVLWRNRYALPAILAATGEWCPMYSDATLKAPMRGWSVLVRRGAHPLCRVPE